MVRRTTRPTGTSDSWHLLAPVVLRCRSRRTRSPRVTSAYTTEASRPPDVETETTSAALVAALVAFKVVCARIARLLLLFADETYLASPGPCGGSDCVGSAHGLLRRRRRFLQAASLERHRGRDGYDRNHGRK